MRIRAAVDVLLAGGMRFSDVTVDRIVSEAGVSRTSFYFYFSSKCDLLDKLAVAVMDELLEPVRLWSGGTISPRGTLETTLCAYGDRAPLIGAITEMAATDRQLQRRQQELIERATDLIAGHIRRGQQAGRVREHLAPEPTARWLAWMAERGMQEAIRSPGRLAFEELVDSLASIVEGALYDEPVSSSARLSCSRRS